MNVKTPKDDFWMMLKVVPIIVSVIFLHQIYPLDFGSAVFIGVPLGLALSWCLAPFTLRLMETRYLLVVDERSNEHPVDAGCASLLFIFFILLAYQMLFVIVPLQRAKNLTKQNTHKAPMQAQSQK
jgi:hypothetical protein